MVLGVLIPKGPKGTDNFDDFTEQDMRRWWMQRCIIDRHDPRGIFIKVGAPVKFRVYHGIKRLASFGVEARAARG